MPFLLTLPVPSLKAVASLYPTRRMGFLQSISDLKRAGKPLFETQLVVNPWLSEEFLTAVRKLWRDGNSKTYTGVLPVKRSSAKRRRRSPFENLCVWTSEETGERLLECKGSIIHPVKKELENARSLADYHENGIFSDTKPSGVGNSFHHQDNLSTDDLVEIEVVQENAVLKAIRWLLKMDWKWYMRMDIPLTEFFYRAKIETMGVGFWGWKSGGWSLWKSAAASRMDEKGYY
ncbi:hypothetical protein L218DRAFT_948462 [Marasmius fiardii PR-910]|nr:hypothetical protein L218DRAFT_948462 [Marasmius fiardii PR-910]